MVLVLKGGVAAVLSVLKVLGQLHLGVEQPVFMDVFLVLDLLGIGELGHRLLVGLVELLHRGLVLGLSPGLLLHAAGRYRLEIVLVEVGLEIPLGVGNELGYLLLVLGLHLLGLLQLLLKLGPPGLLLLSGVDFIPLQVVQGALDVDDLVGAVLAQGVDLLLNGAHIVVNGLAELALLLRSQNIFCHMYFPPHRYFALSRKSSS